MLNNKVEIKDNNSLVAQFNNNAADKGIIKLNKINKLSDSEKHLLLIYHQILADKDHIIEINKYVNILYYGDGVEVDKKIYC